jgi:Methylamine utilisation protein MauE
MGAAAAGAAVAAGCAVSCGALLALAGTSKLYRSVRGLAGSSAIRRALHITKRRWRRVELTTGGFECAVGLVVCGRLAPLLGCLAMAVLGAGFCALLGYARKKHVPGNCACIQWRSAPATSVRAVSWREIARAVLISVAGVAGALSAARQPGTVDLGWSGAGMLAGGVAAVLLSISGPPRTPACRRRLWPPGRPTLRALTRHAVFTAMAESAGPLGPVARHSREGCTDEFWFPVSAEGGEANRSVVFQVWHRGPGGNLAVQASLREIGRNH